jgi:ABC-type lipoprotein release transport system permease subunit
MNNQVVTLPNGQDVSQYEASQVQRNIEVHIRDWKRQRDALLAAGKSNDMETAKVSQWQAQMRNFITQTDLQRQRVREQV